MLRDYINILVSDGDFDSALSPNLRFSFSDFGGGSLQFGVELEKGTILNEVFVCGAVNPEF